MNNARGPGDTARTRLRHEAENIERFGGLGGGMFLMQPMDDECFRWIVTFYGQRGTSYENGIFNLEITLSENYPFHNGTVDARFQTRIYHPLVEPDTGRVLIPDACLYGPRNIETSAPNWHWCLPTGTLHQLCMLLGTTFYDPRFFIPPRSINPPALHFFRDHQDFHNTAREWTQQFAMERP